MKLKPVASHVTDLIDVDRIVYTVGTKGILDTYFSIPRDGKRYCLQLMEIEEPKYEWQWVARLTTGNLFIPYQFFTEAESKEDHLKDGYTLIQRLDFTKRESFV